jgi:hypothetical protein
LIIDLALLGVGEDFIGSGNLLELVLRRGIMRVLIFRVTD